MYDERRRRAAVLKVEAEREKQQQEQQKRIKQRPKSKPKSVTKRTRRVPRVFESSENESVDESEPTKITPDEENITIDETKKDKETDQEINKEKMLLDLIMIEHNYFSSLPKPSAKAKSKRKVLHEKQMNEQVVSEEEYVDIGKIAQFSQRSNSQESDILSELYKQGLDSEDYNFMKLAYERLKERGAKEINEFIWLDHPSIFSCNWCQGFDELLKICIGELLEKSLNILVRNQRTLCEICKPTIKTLERH